MSANKFGEKKEKEKPDPSTHRLMLEVLGLVVVGHVRWDLGAYLLPDAHAGDRGLLRRETGK